MRMTRAQAAAAQVHIDEPVDLIDQSAQITEDQRAPLGELAPNSVDREQENVTEQNSKSNGGKTAKVRVSRAVEEHGEVEQSKQTDVGDAPDSTQEMTSPVRVAPAESSPSRSAMSTRSQIGVQDSVLDMSMTEEVWESTCQSQTTGVSQDTLVVQETSDPTQLTTQTPLDALSPAIEVEELKLIPQRTPARNLIANEKTHMRSTSNKENEQPFSPLPNRGQPTTVSPTQKPAVTPKRFETQAQAADVAEDTPFQGQALNDEQCSQQEESQMSRSPVNETINIESGHTQVEAPQKADPPSLKSSPKPAPFAASKSKSGRPSTRPSTLARTGSVRRSVISKPETVAKTVLNHATSVGKPTSRPSAAIKEVSSGKASQAEKAPAAIPHSKPRPMSISFPTPPAPLRSTKALTKSTFQLPGEAVAAKLKAAREERTKKEEEQKEEQNKRRDFKARPAPKMKDTTATVRQTTSSRARESLMLGKEPGLSGRPRASTVRESITRSRPIPVATKRLSTVPKVAAPRPSTSGAVDEKRSAPALNVAKRASTISGGTSKPRESSVNSTAIRGNSSGTKKGKEVFQRAAAEKEAAEKQKREKEEAAKKARAEASERGRVASRLWSEKMKLKTSKAKGNVGKEGKESTVIATV